MNNLSFKPSAPPTVNCCCDHETKIKANYTDNSDNSHNNLRFSMVDRQKSLGVIAQKQKVTHQTSVPHLFAETPKVVTHHHDTDDEDTDHSDKS